MAPVVFKLEQIQPVSPTPDVLPSPCDALGVPCVSLSTL